MTDQFKRNIFLLLLILQVLYLNCCQQHGTYTNPIIAKGLADPFIFYEKGYYFLFSTGKAEDDRFIPIYKAKDLTQWKFVRGAVSRGSETDWNYKNFWAPEVFKLNNKYYLYYTASPGNTYMNTGNRVGVAISDKIDGPFKNYGVEVTADFGHGGNEMDIANNVTNSINTNCGK